jgi:cell division transport system permease protein
MSRVRLMLSESLRSLGANLSTTVAATMTVLIGMFLLGLFIGLGTWVVSWSDHIKAGLVVKVFFADDANVNQINTVRMRLESDARIKPDGVVFVSKAEALKEMQRKYPDLTENLPGNPLPASFRITPKRGEDVPAIGEELQNAKLAGVDKINWGKKESRDVLRVARVIEAFFLAAVVVLLIASTLLIANTIRLSIFSRRREIEVMKLVGATNWFVRGPFMLEGLICGFVGSIAAIMLLLLGREFVLARITDKVDSPPDVQALAFGVNALALIGVGLLVGAIGSGLTLRRFLQV